MKDLYLMIGIPASGKSTIAQKLSDYDNAVYISRDKIRFSLMKENDSYFEHEKEVVQTVYKEANEYLSKGYDVYIDQTSCTKYSRKLIFENIKGFNHAIGIWVDTDFYECLLRNDKREGLCKVPKDTMYKMNRNFDLPSCKEGFSTIYRYIDGENSVIYDYKEK